MSCSPDLEIFLACWAIDVDYNRMQILINYVIKTHLNEDGF